ncbi:MAG: metallophosphoesterase [Planctomycetales bacterium]|nr:metallophosphoesterase [Planctomycetales bacterium]
MKSKLSIHRLSFEHFEARCMLTGAMDFDPVDEVCSDEIAQQAAIGPALNAAAAVEPQYVVHQPPRLQLGNAPLIGTPAYDGFDQIEVLWQTLPAGNGTDDLFVAQLRDPSFGAEWSTPAEVSALETTTAEKRIVHSAVITGLHWNHNYEYRVQHLRAGELVEEYSAPFKTRRAPGDPTPFTFAAYGDSSVPGKPLENFRAVQRAINSSDAEFAVLLGDNIYDSGTHDEADARFTREQNPEATDWIASHIDYFAIGNHELFGSGIASLDSYSMPIPVAGVNAHAEPPEDEVGEFFGSFDYGNVHFVTFDSNSAELRRGEDRDARMERQADFLVANLEASDAKWKIVYMHHPMVGSAKLTLYPDTNYLEILMPRLIDAGVDVILNGDSHTYAWTYPIVGIDDADGNSEISNSEIIIDDSSPREFQKGVGVVQLISGAGGRTLRSDRFGQPFMAQTHSLDATTRPLDYGFAEITVTDQEMEVRYISAETANIFGDLNGNGIEDAGEDDFAVFRIIEELPFPDDDISGDGVVDINDLDAICAAILGADDDPKYDVNSDGQVNVDDHNYYANEVLHVILGDANLDGRVNSSDLVLIFQAGRYEKTLPNRVTWQQGDWNCDGRFTTSDLVVMFATGLYEQA